MHSIYITIGSLIVIGLVHNTKGLFFNPPPPPPPRPMPPPFIYGQSGQIPPQELIARSEWIYRNTLYLNNPFFNTMNPFYISPYGTRPTQRATTRRPTTESGEEVTEDGDDGNDDDDEFRA